MKFKKVYIVILCDRISNVHFTSYHKSRTNPINNGFVFLSDLPGIISISEIMNEHCVFEEEAYEIRLSEIKKVYKVISMEISEYYNTLDDKMKSFFLEYAKINFNKYMLNKSIYDRNNKIDEVLL